MRTVLVNVHLTNEATLLYDQYDACCSQLTGQQRLLNERLAPRLLGRASPPDPNPLASLRLPTGSTVKNFRCKFTWRNSGWNFFFFTILRNKNYK